MKTAETEVIASNQPAPATEDKAIVMTRDDFGPGKRRYGKLTLDDGREVYFQSLTASELAAWEVGAFNDEGDLVPSRVAFQSPKLLARTLVDKTGKRQFGDTEHPIIADTDSSLIRPIVHAVRKHVGLDRRVDEGEPEKN